MLKAVCVEAVSDFQNRCDPYKCEPANTAALRRVSASCNPIIASYCIARHIIMSDGVRWSTKALESPERSVCDSSRKIPYWPSFIGAVLSLIKVYILYTVLDTFICRLFQTGHDRSATRGHRSHSRGLHGRHHGSECEEEGEPDVLRLTIPM